MEARVFHGIPVVAVGELIVFALVVYLFCSERTSGLALRQRQIFTAFRQADWWQ